MREGGRWRRERKKGKERVWKMEGELQQGRKTIEQGRAREQRIAKIAFVMCM